MDILITGINGFIGARYAARARAAGAARIVGLDLQPQAAPGVPCDRYLQLDLGSPDAPAALAGLPHFDRVLHAGGISGFMVETDRPRRIFDVNVAGTMALLDMARRTRPARLVLCSTIMVYGPAPDPTLEQDESAYPVPISVYGASKLAAEGLMHAFAHQYGVDAVALRFSHVYGPGRTTECFVRTMLSALAQGGRARITQAGGSSRQWVHVDDVVESIERAMTVAALPYRVFNVSGGEQHTLAQTAEAVCATLGPLQAAFDEARDLPNYRIARLSIRRAGEVLGYAPRIRLAQGLRDYWEASFAPGRAR
jgi:UDP-glucuronate 4-epimerase